MNFKEKILAHYELTPDQYAELIKPAHFEDLPAPEQFKDMEKAVKRIFHAIDQKEKIVIYGDYDCDGVMATSILVSALKRLNAEVGYYLPSRYIDGYGLNNERVEQFAEKGYSLIITVDNGVAQHQAIALANSYGIDVIVSDHHQVLNELPDAYAILHPTISEYGEVITCGAYVALMLASALLNEYDEYYAVLAMCATISDMMELTAYNRTIVKLGLSFLNKNNYLQFQLLAGSDFYDENTIAFYIAPKVNAVGRMMENTEINNLVRFFISDDVNLIRAYGKWINEVNEERKETLKTALKTSAEIDESEPAIVVYTDEKEGLIGLLAARYLNLYDKPTIVFKEDSIDPNILKGSARAKTGFSIAKAFKSMDDLFISYGGHDAAGGCSLPKENFTEFKKRFNELAAIYHFDKEDNSAIINIHLGEINYDNYEFLNALAPFGVGFPAPKFKLGHLLTNKFNWSRSNTHILTAVNEEVKIVGWNIEQDLFMSTTEVDLIGTLETNTFRNQTTIQFKIERYVNYVE